MFISCHSLSDKDRKCLYAADGYIEDLSLAELEELAESESKSYTKLQFGSVGWKFQKQFPDRKWYNGVVVKIIKDVGKFVHLEIFYICIYLEIVSV